MAPSRSRLGAVQARYKGSWVQAVVAQLGALHAADWTTIFGAELLWSALPFIILLSSLANERIDDDISRHIGLDRRGAHIVRSLFRATPSHAFVPVASALLITFAGIVAVVASLQVLYERVFGLERRGWRDLPRYVAWVAVLLAALVAEGAVDGPLRRGAGAVVQVLLTFLAVAVFFTWTIHFLLGGRVPWRRVLRTALITALLWLAFALFSAAYFSSVVVDDSRTYGTIGVVFTLLTWFILIGGIILFGAALGGVWQQRAERA